MSTYYVRKSGSDAAAGTSAGASWLTIDKAANTVAAGDTVYIGSGVYRELVTMDTSGTSGNQISYIGDVDGSQTGDAGLVLISGYLDENQRSVGALAACWNLNGKEFITIRGLTMEGAKGIYDNALAGNRAYEGVIIEQCAIIGYDNGIILRLNNGATPAGSTGLTIRNCAVSTLVIEHTNNASANTNVKLLIENVVAHQYLTSNNSPYGINIDHTTSANTFSIGNITIANCVVFGGSIGFNIEQMKDTTNVCRVYNCIAYTTGTAFTATANNATEWYSCATGNGSTATTGGVVMDMYSTNNIGALVAGSGDFTLYRNFGWSPYQPFELMQFTNYEPGVLGYGASDKYLPTTDAYGNPRGLGRGHWAKFYFDGSDAAATDPGTVWTSDTNVTDSSLTTSATVATTGSVSSNYLMAEGTNAPGSGGTINGVYLRFFADTSSSTADGHVSVSTDAWAEVLGTATLTATTVDAYSTWTALSTPSGGWTWAKIQALEFRAWRNSASNTLRIYQVQIAVATDAGHADVGAVESRNRAARESTTVRTGTYALRFDGAGYQEYFIPVAASSTTISVYGRFDANYVGSKPKMEVFNIPGVADQSAIMTGSSGSWEQLTETFTPTSAGVVRVRLSSQDTSVSGKAFFDDLSKS